MVKKKKAKKKKGDLIGKQVRVVVHLGNVTIKYLGVLQASENWVKLKTKDGIKLINKGDTVLIEELKS
jgi:hypothetical protein